MFELRLLSPEDRVEAISDALDALEALSVSVEDADAQTAAEQALFGEPGMPSPKDGWQSSRILALFADEALYAMAHFDADCQPLNGAGDYTLRFEAHELPPARAFWSVTLYDADRFLFANPLRRHALGDRSPEMQYGADGSLTLYISATAPAQCSQWLPAPEGRFYLVLRLYHPTPGAMSWRIPPLKKVNP